MVIDASVWVAAFLPQDSHHEQSKAFLRTVVASGLSAQVPTLVLVEVAGAVSRQTNNAALAGEVVAFMQAQEWLKFVALDTDSAHNASELASRLRLRGADAVYTEIAAANDKTLITLDREMKTRSAGDALCQTPKEWLAAQA
jgi:predicted nucleic acid-binding protein